MASHLSEGDFDIPIPGRGGLRTFWAMLLQYDKLRQYAEALAAVAPALWTITEQGKTMSEIQGTRQSPGLGGYLLGHQFRFMSIMAPRFGAPVRPLLNMLDWNKLLEVMPGTPRGAEDAAVSEHSAAKSFCYEVKSRLQAAGGQASFDEYDLSCALCLVGAWKHRYHVDHGFPFEVRSTPAPKAPPPSKAPAASAKSRPAPNGQPKKAKLEVNMEVKLKSKLKANLERKPWKQSWNES